MSNLGVFDFETPDHRMRLRSVHPGVTVDDVLTATGFELAVPADVAESRLPTPEELELIREVIDPEGNPGARGARPRLTAPGRCARQPSARRASALFGAGVPGWWSRLTTSVTPGVARTSRSTR